MKEFLSQSGYAFVEKNVEDDDAAYDELIALGVRTVPLTRIGDRLVTGFRPEQLRDALADGGSQSDR